MKKACLVVSPPYTGGEIFNRANDRLNRDGCLVFFHKLQEEFAQADVDLNTQDVNLPEHCDYILYNEMPSVQPRGSEREKSYLLLFESELIRPDNWILPLHENFRKIFTWHDEFVDKRKYFKFNFSHYGAVDFLPFAQKKKFCTLIAGDKKVSHPLELYSKRREVIRWFENNHPEQFEFFGVGWDRYTFKGPLVVRALNRLDFLRRLLAEKWSSYRGKVDNKLSVLRNYKFSICYENAKEIPGYITEKIFDSMAAGCVPVYWGAPNISKYVPESCYVDQRKFGSYEELYRYLISMTPEEYDRRLSAIQAYLQSPEHALFAPGPLAKKVAQAIMAGLP